MSCWALLGIEPISDKREIKKAYAEKIKQLNIDEEPEQFQRLKEAFDQALVLADRIDEEESFTSDDAEHFVDLTKEEQGEPITDKVIDNAQFFVEQLTDLYNGKAFFDDLVSWKALFVNELEWSITEHEQIESIVMRFLMDNYPLLSKRILSFLGETFEFYKMAEDVKRRNSFSYYWQDMNNGPDYSFAIYEQIDEEERIPYFYARYELYQMLAKGIPERNLWRRKLVECQGITLVDPALIQLQIAYTLARDSKLVMEHSKWRISGLFGELQALPMDETTEFLSDYIEWLSTKSTVAKLLTKEPSELKGLPYSVFLLLTGNVYAGIQEHLEAQNRFDLLEQIAPSMLPREMTAPVVKQEVKPKQGSSKAVWVIVAAALILLRLVTISERTSVYNPSQKMSPEDFLKESIIEDPAVNDFASKFSELRTSTFMHDQFIYFFYIDPEDEEGRQEFIDEYVVESEKERFLSIDFENLSSLDLENTRSNDVSTNENLVADYGQVNGLRFGTMEYPFVILQLDDAGKIKDIFGKGWTELEKPDYTMLRKSLDVSPWSSRNFFYYSYLVERHRELQMEYQLEFTTDSVKQLLQEHEDFLVETYTFDWTYKDSYDDQEKEYTIFDYKNGEVVLIISYDIYGRVDHVYGEGWETLDENVKKQVLANAEVEE